MSQHRSIEVKVGLLILVAIALLASFLFVMGGVTLQPTTTLNIDFDNPGGLQSGAPVKIAGVKVGRVDELSFRGAEVVEGKRVPLIRVRATVEKRYFKALRQDAIFYVTMQGVLGEQFLAVDPGSPEKPALAEGSAIRGLDPPRIDLVLAEGYELLHTGLKAMRDNREQIAETFQGLHDTLRGTGTFFRNNGDRLDAIAANLQDVTADTKSLIAATRERYVDGPQIRQIIDRIDRTTAVLERDAEPLLKDARDTLANANRVSSTLGAPEQQERIRQILTDLAEVTTRAKAATSDAQAIVSRVKKGSGTVGALVMDEQMYDDLQELVRDLKHNPWKFFWRD